MSVLPLYMHDLFSTTTGLLAGTLIGFFFGFVLERAGFGNARNLAAQFYLTDTRVLKVMFSAIVTACAGLGILSGFGFLDLSMVTVPETFLGPHVVGGLLLGAGFIVSGYCPGTGVVAMASGHLDGLLSIVGVTIGSLAFGFVYSPLEGFYESGAMGSVTLPQLIGVPFAVVAAAVVVMAVGSFLGGEKLEAIFTRKAGEPLPAGSPALRNRVFAGFGAAAVLGLVTVALPSPKAAVAEKAPGAIGPVALAQRIVQVPDGLWLLDLRSPEEAAKARIPGAMTMPPDDPTGKFLLALPATRPLVAYGAADGAKLPEGVLRYPGEVLVLAGGFEGWQKAVLTAPTTPESPTPALIAAFRMRSALHGYFTGAKAAEAPKLQVRAVAPAAAPKKGGGC